MDLSLTPPRSDSEILRAFEASTALRPSGDLEALEEALVASTHLHHAGWTVLRIIRRDGDPVGWVGWVPLVGDRWCSVVLVHVGPGHDALAPPLLCWLAHSGDVLRADHGAGVLETLFTGDRLATACAGELQRHQWDRRAPAPTWSVRHEPTLGLTVQALTWTTEPLPHRCLRRDPGTSLRRVASA
jgi:hypothetical protein